MVIFYGETWPTGHSFEREVVPVKEYPQGRIDKKV